jgi:hypothetical protein
LEVALLMINTNKDIEPDWDIVAFACVTQLSMKAGLKRFREEGEEGVSKELSQLHLRETFEPVDSLQLSRDERDSAMESHLFLMQKRDKTIKGQMAADGNKQCGSINN